MIEQIYKGKFVTVEIVDSLSPTVIRDPDDEDDTVFIVMPMRL